MATRPRFYRTLYFRVIAGIVAGVALGAFYPSTGEAMKPLGDGFIKLIRMMIAPVIFLTVVTGIARIGDMRKLGRVGLKALVYFEVVTTVALLVGFVVVKVVQPGAGINATAATLDATAVQQYAASGKQIHAVDFLLHIIPDTLVGAFANGEILQVLLVAILFGVALAGYRLRQPIVEAADSLTHLTFEVIALIMKVAPFGAFGAMAFTIGKYGVASLGPLLKLIASFWVTSTLFVFIVFGAVCWMAGFSLIRFLVRIKEEILLVLATSSSETAIPTLMEKLEDLGCSRSLVGLIVPTGYTFNTDGSSLYMTMAALFVAQATNTHLTLLQQLTIFAVAVLTSKGASGVQGASFIALVGTLSVIPAIPVAGMALILGIDRFMSMFRALVNMIGNGVATLVVARWEKELDRTTLQHNLAM